MKKQRMVFDLDDVIVVPNILKIANEVAGTNKTFEDIKTYYMEDTFDFTDEQRELFYDKLVSDNIYENAKINEELCSVIKEFSESYDIFIASDSVIYRREKQSAKLFFDKYNFIVRNLPYINSRNIVLCGDKSIVSAKWFIDDKLSNLEQNENIQNKLLFPAYHNKSLSDEELIRKNIVRLKDIPHFKRFVKGCLNENEIRTTITDMLKINYQGKIVCEYYNQNKTGNILLNVKCKDENIELEYEKVNISTNLKKLLGVDVKCC